MGFRIKKGKLTYRSTAGRIGGYKYKNCARCGKYNGSTFKLCSECRKYMRKR